AQARGHRRGVRGPGDPPRPRARPRRHGAPDARRPHRRRALRGDPPSLYRPAPRGRGAFQVGVRARLAAAAPGTALLAAPLRHRPPGPSAGPRPTPKEDLRSPLRPLRRGTKNQPFGPLPLRRPARPCRGRTRPPRPVLAMTLPTRSFLVLLLAPGMLLAQESA